MELKTGISLEELERAKRTSNLGDAKQIKVPKFLG
jgi:hypothetical protein